MKLLPFFAGLISVAILAGLVFFLCYEHYPARVLHSGMSPDRSWGFQLKQLSSSQVRLYVLAADESVVADYYVGWYETYDEPVERFNVYELTNDRLRMGTEYKNGNVAWWYRLRKSEVEAMVEPSDDTSDSEDDSFPSDEPEHEHMKAD